LLIVSNFVISSISGRESYGNRFLDEIFNLYFSLTNIIFCDRFLKAQISQVAGVDILQLERENKELKARVADLEKQLVEKVRSYSHLPK
jgi:hypothetical protein